MGRILLIAALVVVGLFIMGPILGFIWGALKWVLILGLIAAAVMAVMKIAKSVRTGSNQSSY